MKNLTLGLFALATALVLTPAAQADPIIQGTLGVGGGNDQWSSTQLDFISTNATARDATGSFGLVLGVAPATNPATIDTPVYHFAIPDVLIFTVGADTATFTITGPIDVTLDNAQFLDISGTGVLTLTGYDPTVATFSLSSTDSSNNFGTTGSSTFGFDVTSLEIAATPEPTSLLLLGSGILGLAGLLRRKTAKRQI
jgi:hypothetical protein